VIVVATRRLLDEIIEAAVMAEHEMSAMLPDKAVFVGVAQRQATDMRGGPGFWDRRLR
jgi:hypothetical protein